MEFGFQSIGPKGTFEIIVHFSLLYDDNIFNLAFGLADNNGSFDDTAILNNNDRNKILATVAKTIMLFLDYHPECSVYFTGSTINRTRLYRRAINVAMAELKDYLEIFGLVENGNDLLLDPFDGKKNYFAFLIHKK
jgi:hypothetical protein